MTPGSYLPTEYLPVLVLIVIAALFGAVALTIGTFFRLRRPYGDKLSPYESGMPPVGEPRQRFDVKFFVVAMLFVIFDVETVFMYPWALVYDSLGTFAVIEMFVFIGILLVGYVYAWGKGAFSWK